MGNSCCHTESPCSNAEEISGLLKDESKATVPTGETVVGTWGPEGDDDVRKPANEAGVTTKEKNEDVQVKSSLKREESETKNTQENGSLQREAINTSMLLPHTPLARLEENSCNELQDEQEPLAVTAKSEFQQSLAECEDFPTANTTAEESLAPRIPDDAPETAKTQTPPHNQSHNATWARSHSGDGDGPALVAASVMAPKDNKELATGHVPSLSVHHQEMNAEAIRVAPEASESVEACQVADPEDRKSQDISDYCRLQSARINLCGEAGSSAQPVCEPVSTAPDGGLSPKSSQDTKPDPPSPTLSSNIVIPSENTVHDGGKITQEVQNKDGDVPESKENDEMEEESSLSAALNLSENNAEIQEAIGKEPQLAGSISANLPAEAAEPCTARKESGGDTLGDSEEDLYRGAEEMSTSQNNQLEPLLVSGTILPKVEERCSLAPAVDILSYSEREWRGNTAKSALIRKGYKEMSQRFSGVRRVRGDNYCALRATLFQVLSHSTQLPAWLQEEDITMLPKELETRQGLISQWTFPGECLQRDASQDATQQLQGYIELLQNKWQAAVDCHSASERQQLCERLFRGGEEELGLLEALKLLMLGRAVELHASMRAGGEVPLFCWLLFARDSSDCPRSFLSNHLCHVGLSAGLEQVEMFLLGYALQCTIEVYRLYMADTVEFVTYYPDDHKSDWPSVCLVTEDDRHYNVPVTEATHPTEEPASS